MSTPNGPAISPNLLMNFNPYDILEPQRTPHVEKLIEIHDLPSDFIVDASLLDQKPSYDLVDLFQNLYVTPELIKNNGSRISPENLTSSGESTNNIDYSDFFDKIEAGEKVGYTKDTTDAKQYDGDVIRKPKILVPKVLLEDDSDNDEDLIEEILASKTMEKRMLDELKKASGAPLKKAATQDKIGSRDEIDYPRVKVLNVPADIELKINQKRNETKVNTPNRVKPTSFETAVNKTPTLSKPEEIDSDIKAELLRLKLNNNLQTNAKRDEINQRVSPVKIDGMINNKLDFNVIAIKKDEKVYKKKRIIKPPNQTRNFTKGADFYEKSVVLPQIMERIKNRQAVLELRNNLRRKLILDSGDRSNKEYGNSNIQDKRNTPNSENYVKKASTDKISAGTDEKCTTHNTDGTWGKVNPIVLMADCNKERLKAFKQGRAFQDFVMNGK